MLSSVPEILDDLRQGKMVIVVDDEDRENEGDVVKVDTRSGEYLGRVATAG